MKDCLGLLLLCRNSSADWTGIRQEGSMGGRKAQKKTPECSYIASTLAIRIIQTVKLNLVVVEQRESQRFYDCTARKEF